MIQLTRFAARRLATFGIIISLIVVICFFTPSAKYLEIFKDRVQVHHLAATDSGHSLEKPKAPEKLAELFRRLETPLVEGTAEYSSNDYERIFNERMQKLGKTMAKPITEPKVHNLVRYGDTTAGKASATILCLTRNEDLADVITSIQQLEEQFNEKFGYPYTFLNDEEFSERFKDEIVTLLPQDREIQFGKIDPQMWNMPESIDPGVFKEKMSRLEGIQDAEKPSYHNMCRFYSKSFYHHPLLKNYKYVWRLEPNVNFYCQIDYDVFQFMEDNNKIYGFIINLFDSPDSVKSLWKSTMKFFKENPQYLHENGSYEWLKDNVQKPQGYEMTGGYSTCHFWTNFEIINLDFMRSKPYEDFMNFLDSEKGFYYERWGDAPVRSLALALLADRSQIHWFRDIGYQHFPYTNCPKCPADSRRCNGNCKPGQFSPWPSLNIENCLPVWIEHIMSSEELELY